MSPELSRARLSISGGALAYTNTTDLGGAPVKPVSLILTTRPDILLLAAMPTLEREEC